MPLTVKAMAVASALPWHRRSLASWVVSAPAPVSEMARLARAVADMAVDFCQASAGAIQPSGVGCRS